MSESIKLYTDNSAIIDTNVQLGHWHKIVSFHLLKLTEITARTLQKLDSDSTFREFFEVDRLVAWIRDNAFLRTALQLPDGLLKYAYRMSTTLEAECSNVKIYILADTSYRRFVNTLILIYTPAILVVASMMSPLSMPNAIHSYISARRASLNHPSAYQFSMFLAAILSILMSFELV